MFDVLTYQKGGSVLRMLEQFIGPDVFREGIHDYLVTHAYANTETRDLWDALERSSGRPVAPDHGHLDQPGRLPARDRGRRRFHRPAALQLLRRPRRRHRVTLAGADPAPDTRIGRRLGGVGAADGTERHRGRCRRRRPAGQRGRVRVLPRGLRHGGRRPAGGAARRAHPARALQPGVGHLGRHAGRERPAGRPPAAGPRAGRLRRGRPERVVGRHRRARAARPHRSRRRTRRPCRRRAVAARPPGGDAGLGAPSHRR